MASTKAWYKSETIVAILLLAIALIKSLSWVELLSNDEIIALGATIETIATAVFWLIAMGVAIHGRITATKNINL